MHLPQIRKRKVVLTSALLAAMMHSGIAHATTMNFPKSGTVWITGNNVTVEVDFADPHPYRVRVEIANSSNASIEYYSHTDAPYMGGWPYSLNLVVPSNGTNEPVGATVIATGNNMDGTANGTATTTITIKGQN